MVEAAVIKIKSKKIDNNLLYNYYNKLKDLLLK